MYEMAKYYMKKDIKKVLNWQMKYNKTLSDLSALYLNDLDEYYETNVKKSNYFKGLKILNNINEKSVPGLKMSLMITDCADDIRDFYDDIYFVNDFKNLINRVIKKRNVEYEINTTYNRNTKNLSVTLYRAPLENKSIKKAIQKIKEINIKDLVMYQTLSGISLLDLIHGIPNQVEGLIYDYLNNEGYTERKKPLRKIFRSIEDFKKINFDKLKTINRCTVYLYNNGDIDATTFDSIEELMLFLNDIENDGYPFDIIINLFKNISTDFKENRSLIVDLWPPKNEVFVRDLDVLEGFDNYIWSHGLNAFNHNNPVENANVIIDDPSIEICCSMFGKEVGPLGLYVKGDCKFAAINDLASDIDKVTGLRKVNLSNVHERLTKPEDIIKYIGRTEYDDTEGIITNIKIVGLWAKKWWIDDDEDNLLIIDSIKDSTGIDEVIFI